jgi:hypothetical protein
MTSLLENAALSPLKAADTPSRNISTPFAIVFVKLARLLVLCVCVARRRRFEVLVAWGGTRPPNAWELADWLAGLLAGSGRGGPAVADAVSVRFE